MTSNVMESIYDFASEYKYISLVAIPKTCDVYSPVREWVESLVQLEDQNNFYKTFKLNLNAICYKKNHKLFTQNLAKTLRPKRSELQLKYLMKHLKNNFQKIEFSDLWMDENRGGVRVKIEEKHSFSMIVDSWSLPKYRNSANLCFNEYSDPEYALLEVMANVRDEKYERYKNCDYGDDGIRRYKNIENFVYAIKTYFV